MLYSQDGRINVKLIKLIKISSSKIKKDNKWINRENPSKFQKIFRKKKLKNFEIQEYYL